MQDERASNALLVGEGVSRQDSGSNQGDKETAETDKARQVVRRALKLVVVRRF